MDDNRVHLAFAVPVDFAKLGAWVETYAETRAILHNFKLCHKKSNLKPSSLGRLPNEIVQKIISAVEDSIFARVYAPWTLRRAQLLGDNDYVASCSAFDDQDEINPGIYDVDIKSKLDGSESKFVFACLIFEEDFGVKTHFSALFYSSADEGFLTAEAHLIESVGGGEIDSYMQTRADEMSFTLSADLGITEIKPLSEARRRDFAEVVNKFGLMKTEKIMQRPPPFPKTGLPRLMLVASGWLDRDGFFNAI